MSNWRLRLFPPSQRDWGEAYLADSDAGSGLSRVLAYAWYLTIRRNAVGAVVITSSAVTAIVGAYLALPALVNQRPPVVALVAFALVLQGCYTLFYMTGRLSPVEPLAASMLLTGQGAALLLSLSGFGTTAFDYVRWLDQALIGPTVVRVLVATQAVFTIYYFTVGRDRLLSQNHGSAHGDHTTGDEPMESGNARRLSDSLVAVGLMIFGLLAVNLIATPRLRAMPWMILLVVAAPYAIFSYLMVRRTKSPDLSTNMVRSLAFVAIPTLAMFFVFWRTLGDLGQAALPGVVVLTSGAITGAGFLTLRDRRATTSPRSGNSA